MAGLMSRTSTRREGEAFEAARPRGRSRRDAGLLVREAARAATERQAGIADVVTAKKRLELQTKKLEESSSKLETQARRPSPQGREDLARAALERKSAVQQQLQSLDQQVAAAGGATGEADREREAALGQGRGLPLAEGDDQGPVLGRRGAGARSARRRRGSASRWPTPGSRSSAPRTRPSRCRRAPRPSMS